MSQHVWVPTTSMHAWSQMVTPLVNRSVDDVLVKVKPCLHQAFSQTSMSWIFVSYTQCCITPQISKFKAHDDPGPLWWSYDTSDAFSLVMPHCNITFSLFWLSQCSAAILIRWGGWSSCCHMWCLFLNLTVKTALKSVDFSCTYRQK